MGIHTTFVIVFDGMFGFSHLALKKKDAKLTRHLEVSYAKKLIWDVDGEEMTYFLWSDGIYVLYIWTYMHVYVCMCLYLYVSIIMLPIYVIAHRSNAHQHGP